MAVDIKKLNQNQLNDLINKAEQRKQELEKEKLVKVRDKVTKLLKDEGFTFEEVFGARGAARRGRRSTGKVPPKYSNPDDPTQTWSGRGKRPRWFNAALKAGKKEKDLLIK
ncbi:MULTISPECIES: H-NS histone family protein [Oleiagrimonas]|jgi:DNA-binding protein H-NS|uniref:H-NS histone family protein n=1 Tax=Oleiagrimonas citrea TaxID=1665687 RepID=A0A846ZJI7_9GAMM|nr:MULTISPECIES: H-NS histone family protein [Oleiagrimonas]NKZ38156.1 H-NS histone family protein [Oleiagrimonas citrea]RAP58530.1 histidine biosynthesis protein [Oleiagrimonas sp. MCCC 1A03011]